VKSLRGCRAYLLLKCSEPLALLCHQAVLQCAAEVALVAETHRPQFHQACARAAHVADVALVTGRGRQHAELAVAIDGYVGARNRRAANPGNKGSVVPMRMVLDSSPMPGGGAGFDVVVAQISILLMPATMLLPAPAPRPILE